MLWKKNKKLSLTRQIAMTAFWIISHFCECFYNSIQTQKKNYLYILEKIARKIQDNHCYIDHQSVNSFSERHH